MGSAASHLLCSARLQSRWCALWCHCRYCRCCCSRAPAVARPAADLPRGLPLCSTPAALSSASLCFEPGSYSLVDCPSAWESNCKGGPPNQALKRSQRRAAGQGWPRSAVVPDGCRQRGQRTGWVAGGAPLRRGFKVPCVAPPCMQGRWRWPVGRRHLANARASTLEEELQAAATPSRCWLSGCMHVLKMWESKPDEAPYAHARACMPPPYKCAERMLPCLLQSKPRARGALALAFISPAGITLASPSRLALASPARITLPAPSFLALTVPTEIALLAPSVLALAAPSCAAFPCGSSP